MKYIVKPSSIKGEALIPSSKSHTIRAVFIAALARGESIIKNPLESADGLSALSAVTSLGAEADRLEAAWRVRGAGGRIATPSEPVDVGNSGTTANFILSMAALGDAPITITGDEQTRARPVAPLLEALSNLGAKMESADSKLPVTITGPIKGGRTKLDGSTSQYLSSLLIHAPLALGDTEIFLDHLNEKPYVDMTLRWLDRQGIEYERDSYSRFMIRGGQRYSPFEEVIPGDFSSATFFACMGAIPGNEVRLLGLDMEDTQGDKAVFEHLSRMGARVKVGEGGVTVTGDRLKGVELDLNATPDALPAMAALASLADGVTTLGNVPQARIKETDRIAVMAEELGKMGVHCEERPDALIVRGGKPKGAKVSGHGDHRVVMSLALLASGAEGVTEIETAEAVNITFPTFAELFNACGGTLEKVD